MKFEPIHTLEVFVILLVILLIYSAFIAPPESWECYEWDDVECTKCERNGTVEKEGVVLNWSVKDEYKCYCTEYG